MLRNTLIKSLIPADSNLVLDIASQSSCSQHPIFASYLQSPNFQSIIFKSPQSSNPLHRQILNTISQIVVLATLVQGPCQSSPYRSIAAAAAAITTQLQLSIKVPPLNLIIFTTICLSRCERFLALLAPFVCLFACQSHASISHFLLIAVHSHISDSVAICRQVLSIRTICLVFSAADQHSRPVILLHCLLCCLLHPLSSDAS